MIHPALLGQSRGHLLGLDRDVFSAFLPTPQETIRTFRCKTSCCSSRRGIGGLPPSRLTKSRAGSIASSGAGDDSNASGLMPASALAGSGNGDDSSLDGMGTEDTV